MAYTLFEKGHTVSAVDFDNNYKWVGQGHLLPKGGAFLEETTGAYDLGSDTYRWNNVHVQNLEIQSGGEVQHCMNLIAEATLTSTATSIEFTGLNGETDEIYEIICNIKMNTSGANYLYLNSDSTTNNYGYQYFIGYSTTVSANRGMHSLGIRIGNANSTTTIYNKLHLICYAKNSVKLFLNNELRSVINTYVGYCMKWGCVWNNSATLTSMKFIGSFDPDTNIQLWTKK